MRASVVFAIETEGPISWTLRIRKIHLVLHWLGRQNTMYMEVSVRRMYERLDGVIFENAIVDSP